MPVNYDAARLPAPSPAAPPVPLFDNQTQIREIEAEIVAAICRVTASGKYILGPDVTALETELAAWLGAKHAVGCASGSDALLLALMALEIGPGDEVIVPSYTFFATVSAVTRLGARPVFVDIEPQGYNCDPAEIASRVTSRTRAIIPVHLYGQCADMTAIRKIADQRGIGVIEDACQAIGAELQGRRAGTLGQMACFSFYPTKNLGGLGDGGMLATDDPQHADRLTLLRGHGMRPRYHHQAVGINSRLDSLQAAVLRVKLRHLERWTARRRAIAARYAALFAADGLDSALELPVELRGRKHVWNQYVIRVRGGDRDALQRHLTATGIGTEIYYPIPLHLQPCYRDLGGREGMLPETERAARETLALPIFPELSEAQQDRVVSAIAAFLGKGRTGGHATPPAPKFQSLRNDQRQGAEHRRG